MAKGKKGKKASQGQPQPGGAKRSGKVSKELQTVIDRIAGLAQEPLAREIIVAAAGAALAARKDARKAAKKAAQEAGDAVDDSPVAAGWVGAAVTAAAMEAGRRLLNAYDEKQGGGTGSAASGTGVIGKAGKMRKVLKAAD